jgi:hypothetical protein
MNTQKKSDSKTNFLMTRDAGARMLKALMASSILALAAGCGSTDPGEGDDGAAGESGMIEGKPFLPLAEGNRWVYQVTQDGIVMEKTTVVGPLETVGGSGPHASAMAHRMTTSKGVDGTDETISWQALAGARVVRYREQAYGATSGMLTLEEHWNPPKLRVDQSAGNTVTGATWLEITAETKLPVGGAPVTSQVNDNWLVIADDATVTVPAGTFENVLHLRKVGATSSLKEYWWAKGVGKVKETGGQTEELVSYEVAE